MSSHTIHLFLNPIAGRGRAGKRQGRILQLLQQAGLDVDLHLSQHAGDLEAQVLATLQAGAEHLIGAGGDGSIHEAVNGIFRSGFEAGLGVIPTGTGNDFAKACDIPLNWEHATSLLADRIAANETPRKIDVGRFNDRFFANGAGVGFDAKVTRVAQSIRIPMGDLVYLVAIFRTMLGGIVTPTLTITTDDFQWDAPVTLAAISNGPWIGGMFHIAPMAKNADGIIELLIAKPVTRRRICSLLPKLMNGTHVQENDIIHHPVTSLRISCNEAIPSHLDGEVQPLQSEFEIRVLPGALNLL
ncbi:MAG TPA: diacylglycerol kinase family lipid kinase [Woeseiaceae bacterium]|nr:diacylglycerol kinase family lipid kinase [Woeseiaceae bacterium]